MRSNPVEDDFSSLPLQPLELEEHELVELAELFRSCSARSARTLNFSPLARQRREAYLILGLDLACRRASGDHGRA